MLHGPVLPWSGPQQRGQPRHRHQPCDALLARRVGHGLREQHAARQRPSGGIARRPQR